jgi:hypothetical protein
MAVDNHNDQLRAWKLKNAIWNVHYERYEYTRLQRVRALMDQHLTYDKERMLKEGYEEVKESEKGEKKKP